MLSLRKVRLTQELESKHEQGVILMIIQNKTHRVIASVTGCIPDIQRSVPVVGGQTITITAYMDRISRTRCRTFRCRTENTVICRNVSDVTAI